jgi:Protein of unknown function (DUF4197)
MKKLAWFLLLGTTVGCTAQPKFTPPKVTLPKEISSLVPVEKPLTEDEVGRGLKEALSKGAEAAAAKVSATDGFFRNDAIKLLWPEDAKKVESKLRSMGMNKLCDDFTLSMNRAAEEACKKAAPIFIKAITSMTVKDAMGILRGSDRAATDYLQRTTSNELRLAFQPEIEKALQQVNATKYWTDIASIYNKIPLVTPVTTDLPGFVTDKAMAGLFVYVAEKEAAIRNNPLERTTEILKRVFKKS